MSQPEVTSMSTMLAYAAFMDQKSAIKKNQPTPAKIDSLIAQGQQGLNDAIGVNNFIAIGFFNNTIDVSYDRLLKAEEGEKPALRDNLHSILASGDRLVESLNSRNEIGAEDIKASLSQYRYWQTPLY